MLLRVSNFSSCLLPSTSHFKFFHFCFAFKLFVEVNDLLRSIGKSLKNFEQLPQPPDSYLNHGSNNLIIEETTYDTFEMEKQHNELFAGFNEIN